MATIQVRALSPTWDPLRGNGLNNFLVDLQAVAQIIATRLKLNTGEWFESINDGTPLFTELLGVPTTSQAIALILRNRILGSPYVDSILSMECDYAPPRTFTFRATVSTQFGTVTVGNQQQ